MSLGWISLNDLIKSKAYAELKRSPEMQEKYKKFYTSVPDLNRYIESLLFPESTFSIILRQNDFPYDVAPSIIHYVLWCNRELSEEEIYKYLSVFPAFTWFRNPSERRTVDQVFHVQVFLLLKR